MALDPAATAQLARALATAVAVPVTPLRPSGQVDWDAHARVIRRLVDGGITVVTPNGNTGEFYALDPAEPPRLVESAVEAAGGRSAVMAGVGLDIATAIGAARHAARADAQMVMVHQPVHPYLSAEGWVEYHAAIAAVARDAGLDRLTWLAGSAELAAPGYWAVGARGFTSGLANVAPGLSLEMLDALRAGDFPRAMKVWEAVRPFEELRAADSSADNVSVVKQALAQLGVCGAEVRPPSRPLPAAVRDQISAILGSWGLTGAPA